jgi:hypothetical protein
MSFVFDFLPSLCLLFSPFQVRPLNFCGAHKATPGSLAYYGGRQWDRYRTEARSSLEPYVFEGDSN